MKLQLWGILSCLTILSACSKPGGNETMQQQVENQPPVSTTTDQTAVFDSSQVIVTLGNWYVDKETNFLQIFGAVTNNTSRPITGQVAFRYYDGSGQAISADVLGQTGDDSVPFSGPIAPGQKGYFNRPRDLAKLSAKEISRVEAKLWYAKPHDHAPLGHFPAPPQVQLTHDAMPEILINGVVKNSGDVDCSSPVVWIALLSKGRVLYTAEAVTERDDSLPAGAEAAFNFKTMMSFINLPEPYDEVQFALECSWAGND